jgi:hypothetical protein
MHFRGDTGLFRSALMLAGFFPQAECSIFNDNHKSGGRRLKLWFADSVFKAPQEQQKALEKELRAVFGDRIKTMYFVDAPYWVWCTKSLCIQLKEF